MAKNLIEIAMWCSLCCLIITVCLNLTMLERMNIENIVPALCAAAVSVALYFIVCHKKKNED